MAQLCHYSYREDWRTQCIVWKGLKELPLQRKLVCLVVHISDNLMEATYQKSQSTAMLPVTMHS